MFVDKLRLAVTAQEDAEIVKPGDDTLKFHPIDQKNRYRDLGFSNVIEKRVLQILFVAGHFVFAFVIGLVARWSMSPFPLPEVTFDAQSM
jgi:hypothetical protein